MVGVRNRRVADDQLTLHTGLLMAGDRAEELEGTRLIEGEVALNDLAGIGLERDVGAFHVQVVLNGAAIIE